MDTIPTDLEAILAAMEQEANEETAPEPPDPWAPIEYAKKRLGRPIAVFDSETDPFADGRIPEPFTCGFKSSETYEDFWGDDCIEQFVAFLYTLEQEHVIYCHNFGGFDYRFLAPYIDEGTFPSIINGRVASCRIAGHEFRDSYRIIPVALGVYQKDKFDYSKMEREAREKNRAEILLYQRHDCDYLFELVVSFYEYFGDRPTIGNTAINYLQHFHRFERIAAYQDRTLRPFFFGGRTQAFESGILRGPWEVYDVNSMYPHVMRSYDHPLSGAPIVGRGIHDTTAFVRWRGENQGAVPQRLGLELDFNVKYGEFFSSIHEFKAAKDLGLIRPDMIVQTIGFERWGNFADFIDHFYALRLEAKKNGDKMGDLFNKLIMNSAYGKFAQDPSRYEQYRVSVGDDGFPEADEIASEDKPDGWRIKSQHGDVRYWARPSRNRWNGFFNVGIGASITGAARAELLRGISQAQRPVYCDTDSIICRGFRGEVDSSKLGGWKLEAVGDLFACAGKKLYALFSFVPSAKGDEETAWFEGRKIYCVKKASKGAALSAAEILAIAKGDVVKYVSDRPNFKLDGSVEFVAREIRRTG